MIKILLVRDYNSCNTPYLLYCFYLLTKLLLISFTEVSIQDYLDINQSSYDLVIYAPFPDENSPQFNKIRPVIPETDDKFLSFKRTKILFDGHDHGNIDGCPRFNDVLIPRIKNAPHIEFSRRFNVIFSTTYPIGMYVRSPVYKYIGSFSLFPKTITKNIDIRVNISEEETYRARIRKAILEILHDYPNPSIDTEYKTKEPNYLEYLSRVLISICPPGHGPGSFRHLETLNAKSLMFSHDSINEIKLLPNTELIEGEDYVSFNLDNMKSKLDQLMSSREKINQILENGHRKFRAGYSVVRSSWRLYHTFRELV